MFKRSNNLALPHQSGRNCEKNKVKTEILEVNGSTRQPMKKVCVYTGGGQIPMEREWEGMEVRGVACWYYMWCWCWLCVRM